MKRRLDSLRRKFLLRLNGVESLEPRFLMAASVGDYVWNDFNADGIQNEDASFGINGVTVALYNSLGVQVGTPSTTANGPTGDPGFYSFDNVAPGDYYVVFQAPAGFVFTTRFASSNENDNNADSNGKSDTFTLFSGTENPTIDAGLVAGASVGNFVWWDQNADGLQADVEPGIEGATVRLLQNGLQMDTILTDEFGGFFFTNLPPGTYSLQFDYPVGFSTASPSDVGNNTGIFDRIDSDGLGSNLITAPFTLAPGETNRQVDQGFYQQVAIGDYVWRDVNNDGIQNEPANAGVNGVSVTLFNTANNQVGSPIVTSNDVNGNPGYYKFSGLQPGQYYIVVTPPTGQVFTSQAVGDPAKDSNVNASGRSGVIDLLSGLNDLTIDAGLRPIDLSLTKYVTDTTPPIGQTITYVVTVDNASGLSAATGVLIEDVLPNGLQYISDNSGGLYNNTTRTWTLGNLASGASATLQVVATVISGGTKVNTAQVLAADQLDFDSNPGNAAIVHEDDDASVSIIPSANVGDYVWRDVNNDGIQNEAPSFGLNGVTVRLFNSVGVQVGMPVITANDNFGNPGFYQFSDVDPGSYYVVFDAPSGQVFTTRFAGAVGADSNADSTGKTANFTLVSGTNDLTIDAGLRPIDLSLTKTVDNTAPTVGSNVNFTLTLTNAIGFSTATGVTVKDVLPAGLTFVSAAFSDVTDTYAANIWTIGTLAAGQSATLTITATVATSGTKTNYAEVSAANQFDFDSQPNNNPGPTPTQDDEAVVNLTPPAIIGDVVWRDTNANGKQDSLNQVGGEPGIPGVTVTLTDGAGNSVLNASGVAVAPQVTNATGGYLFTNLVPGTYKVTFSNLPAGFVFTTQDVSANGFDTIDSDANPANGMTGNYTLVSGDNNLTVDAGAYLLDSSLCVTGPMGGVDLGALPNYLFLFTNGSQDANWQSASKGFVGDVVINGQVASERTSGSFAYAGTIHTNDTTLGPWQNIVDANPGQASASLGETTLVANVTAQLIAAFAQINALEVTPTFANRSSTSLDGLNTTNGVNDTIVINVTSDFDISSQIDITGDAGDVFVMRWDTDSNASNGYQGQVKFQSGGAIVPHGGLTAGNFIHVAGDINASGGGSTPSAPYPQGPRLDDGQGNLIAGADDFNGGGFFTGYWLTTGDPSSGDTSSLSNAIFVGGWFSLTDKFSMTSGTSGTHVCPATETMAPRQALGDLVWYDIDSDGINDAGEPGVSGATVKLMDTAGNVLATATTGIDGRYLFTGLAAGNYKVMFLVPPGFDGFTTANVGINDAVDSDADQVMGITDIVNLSVGETDLTVDAGLVKVVPPGLEINKDVVGAVLVAPNTPVTFTYSVRNTGTVPASNVVVTDDNATPDFAGDDFKPTRHCKLPEFTAARTLAI